MTHARALHRHPWRIAIRAFAVTACLVAATTAAAAGDPAADASDPVLAACRDRVARPLPEAVRATLPRIDGVPSQLLALRSYLRVRDLGTRWSWTDAQIAAWTGSPGQREALDAVARVQRAFAAQNPGYMLYANLQVRSLEQQLSKWNGNASVRAAAEQMAAPARAACAATPATFANWLREWKPAVAPTLAAPGLSPHGQGRAFDFQVQSPDPVLVAGTDAKRMQADWHAGGWAQRLAEAVRASGAAFVGPLLSPDEPWHYGFVPATQGTAQAGGAEWRMPAKAPPPTVRSTRPRETPP